MEVNLIAHTPNPEEVCILAARSTRFSKDENKIRDSNDKEYLKRIISWGHTSVIEHVSFTFEIKGISRACSHQVVRHRIASYSQQSQRKVKPEGGVIPHSIEANHAARSIYEEELERISDTYDRLIKLGIPKEDCRYILANGTCTNIIVTMNARALLNFFELRMAKDAQWEIRELATEMLNLVYKVAPNIFECVYKSKKDSKSFI